MPSTHQTGPPFSPQVLPFVHPLDEFYAEAQRPLPVVEILKAEELPQPYQGLLVHQQDMTSRLEAFHGSALRVSALGRHERGDFYYREVVLIAQTTGRPVEYGAIKINLMLFPPAGRRMILEENLPLGRILAEQQVHYQSRPKAFLKIISDDFIGRSLGLGPGLVLYGRRNTLSDLQHRSLAEIVEILPPALEVK